MDNNRFKIEEKPQRLTGRPSDKPWTLTDFKTGWLDHFRTRQVAIQHAEQLERDDKIGEFIDIGIRELQTRLQDRFQITPREAERMIKRQVQ